MRPQRNGGSTHTLAMAEEHGRLYDMVGYLKYAIVEAGDVETATQATRILHDRMELHFATEERIAGEDGTEWADLLHTEHQALLAMIRRVDRVPFAERGERERLVVEFMHALARHDTEIDSVVFHTACRRH
jgi:hemerythrin